MSEGKITEISNSVKEFLEKKLRSYTLSEEEHIKLIATIHEALLPITRSERNPSIYLLFADNGAEVSK